MTAVQFVFCDQCNPTWIINHPGTWKGTVKTAILHGWYRPICRGTGGGNVPALIHFCPKCKP